MRRNPLPYLLATIFLVGCETKSPPQVDAPSVDSIPPEPGQVEARFTEGAVVDFWMSDTFAWQLRSSDLRQDMTRERVWAKPVNLESYDSKGRISAHVVSDSGAMDRNMRFFRAWGHVIASNKGGMELRADSIVFDKDADRIHTASRVRVKTESGDVLTGRGFRSDAHLNHWEILSDVKGSIRNLNSLPFGLK
ncbi:MAG: LPS export ABC transporter periplasmic protein LptC [Fibrobacteria bacterium]|nr:LPS export ABC transporter periplasmic protein LptC [Fibrobacteria bacterium]